MPIFFGYFPVLFLFLVFVSLIFVYIFDCFFELVSYLEIFMIPGV